MIGASKLQPCCQRFWPSNTQEWSLLVSRALSRPLDKVYFPRHFYIRSLQGSQLDFCPYNPVLKLPSSGSTRSHSAVLVLLTPVKGNGVGTGFPSLSPNVSSGLTECSDLCITLTKRSLKVRAHPGELSFPGGHLHNDEGETPVEAAIRETAEEIGLNIIPSWVLGTLTTIPALSGLPVTPVVAMSPIDTIDELQPFVSSPNEVDSIHYVHLSNLLLRSGETFAHIFKNNSRSLKGGSFFPCLFASASATKPSGSVVEAARKSGFNCSKVAEDGPYDPLLPEDYPGELVWGLTSLVISELVSRLVAEMMEELCFEKEGEIDYRDSALPYHGAGRDFLSCSNVVARAP